MLAQDINKMVSVAISRSHSDCRRFFIWERRISIAMDTVLSKGRLEPRTGESRDNYTQIETFIFDVSSAERGSH